MTPHSATNETPYFLVFGAEIVVPVEIGLPSYHTAHFSYEKNDDSLRAELDLLKEKLEAANLQAVAYKQCSAWYYNSRVKNRAFKVEDLVLMKVMHNTKELNFGVLGPNWEGLY